MTLAVLIPAAGCSSRLGQTKQLVKINGRPLLQDRIRLCADAITTVHGRIFCVLGANAHQIRHEVLDPRCRFLFYPQWQQGLGHTIAFGMQQMPKQTTAVLIMLSDQWAIETNDLLQLVKCAKQHPNNIIASCYQDTIGVPAIFPKAYFEHLTGMKGQTPQNGAKTLILKHIDSVITVDMAHAQQDLDTPEQLHLMQQQLQQRSSH